ncbi:type IV pilus biogenesis protein PilM [Marinobacter fonticola]|uniref:hypothetical protein n=1 Tax=Marinobacter fonticola TaxID=2603215 RepID=UPI001D0DBB68|nr:hypothetical protein [Marinobacter fonticola]
MSESFLRRLFQRGKRQGSLSLEVRADGLAWSYSAVSAVSHGFLEGPPARRQALLDTLVAEHGWSGARARLILPMDQYQVFQLDRPDAIADDELADALRWKLKDLLEYSPAEAVCDVFPFPEDASRGRGELINVVAARKTLARELVKLVENAGLELERIDIAELALRNLAASLDAKSHGVALVHLRENDGQMVICRGNTLYLSRKLDVSSESLRDAAQQDGAVQSLALEIQRSLDYFESQLGQIPPRRLYLVARDNVMPLAPMLASYVAVSVETFDAGELGLKDALDSRCLPALGGNLALGGSSA